jgi:hypothetical protein
MENTNQFSTLNTNTNSSSNVTSGSKSSPKNNQKFINLFLIGSVILLVVALGVKVVTSQFSNGSKAAGLTYNPTTKTFTGHSPVSVWTSFPKKYNGIEIAPSVFTDATKIYGNNDRAREYINDKVARYLIYSDVLSQERDSIPQNPNKLTFAMAENGVTELENQVKETSITSINFIFFKARFAFGMNDTKVKAKYSDPQTKAREMIQKYQQLVKDANGDENKIAKIFNDSNNNDPDLTFINNHEPNMAFAKYHPDDTVFPADPGFDQFLLQQKEKTVSDIYTIKLEDGSPSQYAFVYVFKKDVSKYNTVDELVKDKLSNFSN